MLNMLLKKIYKYSLVYLTHSLESERTRKPIGLKQKHLRNQTSPAAYLSTKTLL